MKRLASTTSIFNYTWFGDRARRPRQRERRPGNERGTPKPSYLVGTHAASVCHRHPRTGNCDRRDLFASENVKPTGQRSWHDHNMSAFGVHSALPIAALFESQSSKLLHPRPLRHYASATAGFGDVMKLSLSANAIIIFIHQYTVDVENNTRKKYIKNSNNLTKQMFVHNIQFVNNIISKW